MPEHGDEQSEWSYAKAVRDGSNIEAHIEFRGNDIKRLRYPNGEVAKGVAAGILVNADLKPVCDFESVPFDKTPFEQRGGH